jgi:hypothetical protein
VARDRGGIILERCVGRCRLRAVNEPATSSDTGQLVAAGVGADFN